MSKWNFIIDIEKCEDCNNCFLACKDEHVDNEWPGITDSQPRHGHRWINIMRKERGQFPLIDVAYRPTPCMHCDDAPCIAADSDAIFKREDGIVLIDPQKSKGRKELVKSCPYGAIYWNDEKNVPQKCTFCAHLLDTGWKTPRCAQVCPTGALKVFQADDRKMENLVKSENLKILHPEYKTSPRVYYKNLHRFNRCLTAGSVAVKSGERVDCAVGAKVILRKDSMIVAEAITDNYGDYKIDNLKSDMGILQLEVVYKAFEKKTITIEMKQSLSLDEIIFEQ